MKQFFAFLLILCHVNGSMLLPQVAEEDVYTANGMQADDINSVVEYIDQVILGNEDDTPEDEDDDSGQHFHLVKQVDTPYTQVVTEIFSKAAVEIKKHNYAGFKNKTIPSPFFEILVPPPDHSA